MSLSSARLATVTLSIGLFLVLWQILAAHFDSRALPGPIVVLAVMGTDLASGELREQMFSIGTVPRIVPEVVFQIDGLSPVHLERRLIPPTQDAP